MLTSWPGKVESLPDGDAFRQALRTQPVEGRIGFIEGDDDRLGFYHRVGSYPIFLRVTQSHNALETAFADRLVPLAAFAVFGLLALGALIALAWRMARSEERTRAALNDEVRRRTAALVEETHSLDTLNKIGMMLAAELDPGAIVQAVVDSATALSGGRYGAFFYVRTTSTGETLRLSVLSGSSTQDFADLGDPRETALFAPTFEGNTVVRSPDITRDPRYGGKVAGLADGGGMPAGHPPVRSYLAVPVVSAGGTAHGAILLGHPEPDRFGDREEALARGLAAQAAVALDNAQLFEARKAAEARQRVLIDELNHRVKNMLATVKAVLRLSARSASDDVETFVATFTERLSSLAATHTILTDGMRQTAGLRELLDNEVAPYAGEERDHVRLVGPDVELPSRIAVPLGMALHELTTNAVKYGALSVQSGQLAVRWRLDPANGLAIEWLERGGPPATPPTRSGFGSQLLERVLVAQLGADCTLDYEPEGLRVAIIVPLPSEGHLKAAAA